MMFPSLSGTRILTRSSPREQRVCPSKAGTPRRIARPRACELPLAGPVGTRGRPAAQRPKDLHEEEVREGANTDQPPLPRQQAT